MVKVAMTGVLLMALVPRPTVIGPLRFAAPLLATTIVFASLWHYAAHRHRSGRGWLPVSGLMLLLVTAVYGTRVLGSGSVDEYQYVVSRFLMVFVVIALCYFAATTGPESLWRALSYGVIVLSALVLFIGVTGVTFLEAARPGRTLGITVPLFKSTGVPRSYGEQGIIAALATSYLLGYWSQLTPRFRNLLSAAVLVLVVVGQSRNMLLAVVATVAVWFLATRRRRYVLVGAALLVAGLATFFVRLVLPVVGSTAVGQALIGEGVFEVNVFGRFTLVDDALVLIRSDPSRFLLGFEHSDWSMYYSSLQGEETGIHNNIVASLLFLGVFAGMASLYLLYAGPARLVLHQLRHADLHPEHRQRRLVAVTGLVGTLTSLNFYEGFFSLVVAVQVGILWALATGGDRSFAGGMAGSRA